MKPLFNFGKKPLVISLLLITGIIAGYFFFKGDGQINQVVKVIKGTIAQEVIVTGKTKPIEKVDLAFEKSGKVSRVRTSIGNKIKAGQIIAELESSDLFSELAEAEANVDAQKAKLLELNRGTRPEEIDLQETKVKSAGVALENSKTNTLDKLQDAYTKSDDAIRNKADQFFENPRSTNVRFKFILANAQLQFFLESERASLETSLNLWRTSLDNLDIFDDLDSPIASVKNNLNKTKVFLDNAASAVNSLLPSSSLSQTIIDAYKADAFSARTNVNTAISNLSSAEEKLRNAEFSLSLEENQLSLLKSGSTREAVAIQEAVLKQAEARVRIIYAQIEKNILRAPIDGTVTKQDAKVGEIVSPNSTLVTIISESRLEVEANIPEVDIGKVVVGNPVKITLDALASETFSGKISYIDPAEIIVDGVVNFRVTMSFDVIDPRFKSGLTANLRIQTLTKNDVLLLPQFAVLENDNGTFIKKSDKSGEIVQVLVVIGIRDQDGMVEIISGVQEGEEVLNIGFKTQ